MVNAAKQEKKTVYVISGPTATGKSLVAFYLAKRLDGEIINADSVQLYRYMDVGSAKPSPESMQRIPHHLYGIVEPDYPMTVAKYQQLAFTVIDDILSRGKTPIVVGGTGLYLNALLYNMSFASSPGNPERRRKLEALADLRGNGYLFELLTAVDPDAAARIHPNNRRKIIRAIEAYENGSRLEAMRKLRRNTAYDFKVYILTMERTWLYERINHRVDKLMREGLLEEVRALARRGYDESTPSMKGIGYKELLAYLQGRTSLPDAVEKIKTHTRHYAKRQMTWFKKLDQARWIEIRKGESVGAVIDDMLSE